MSTPLRQPAGTPAGGRFAARSRPESAASLTRAGGGGSVPGWQQLADSVGAERADELREASFGNLAAAVAAQTAVERELGEQHRARGPAELQPWQESPGETGRHEALRNDQVIVVDDLGDRFDVTIHDLTGGGVITVKDFANSNLYALPPSATGAPGSPEQASLDDVKLAAARLGDELADAATTARVTAKEIGDACLRDMLGGRDPDSFTPPF